MLVQKLRIWKSWQQPMPLSHVLWDICPLERCFSKFGAHFCGSEISYVNNDQDLYNTNWQRIEKYRKVYQVIGYLLHEKNIFPLSILCIHTDVCHDVKRHSLACMSHGQKILKATALDKFSYIYTSRRVQEGLL